MQSVNFSMQRRQADAQLADRLPQEGAYIPQPRVLHLGGLHALGCSHLRGISSPERFTWTQSPHLQANNTSMFRTSDRSMAGSRASAVKPPSRSSDDDVRCWIHACSRAAVGVSRCDGSHVKHPCGRTRIVRTGAGVFMHGEAEPLWSYGKLYAACSNGVAGSCACSAASSTTSARKWQTH